MFLAVALVNSINIYAWDPKPYNKFREFKVSLLFPSYSSDRHTKLTGWLVYFVSRFLVPVGN